MTLRWRAATAPAEAAAAATHTARSVCSPVAATGATRRVCGRAAATGSGATSGAGRTPPAGSGAGTSPSAAAGGASPAGISGSGGGAPPPPAPAASPRRFGFGRGLLRLAGGLGRLRRRRRRGRRRGRGRRVGGGGLGAQRLANVAEPALPILDRARRVGALLAHLRFPGRVRGGGGEQQGEGAGRDRRRRGPRAHEPPGSGSPFGHVASSAWGSTPCPAGPGRARDTAVTVRSAPSARSCPGRHLP